VHITEIGGNELRMKRKKVISKKLLS